jgi:hypothetical protein
MLVRLRFGSWGKFLKVMGVEPVKFIPTKNGITRKGTRNKKRKKVDALGYVTIFEPTHPVANKNGYARLHRIVAYNAGLLTDLSMEVHHINGNRKDNRLENLQVISKIEHAKISTPLGSKRPRRNSRKCKMCDLLTGSKYQLCTKHLYFVQRKTWKSSATSTKTQNF